MSGTPSYRGYQRVALVAAPLAALLMLCLPVPSGMTIAGWRTAAVCLLMAVWWITEALPLAATSLLPIALFPLLGVLSATEVALAYGDKNIFLFLGGFFIAMSIQKWGLHERIALTIVHKMGTDLRRLVLGFMVATALLSMWISNTATTVMMLPIGLAVGGHVRGTLRGRDGERFASCLLLATAYAASIGGVATLIGTPPNIQLAAMYAEYFPEADALAFLPWVCVGLPFSVVFLPLVWLLLTRVIYRIPAGGGGGAAEDVARRLRELGPMSRGEKTVMTVTILCALGWVFRRDIDLGAFVIPGWAGFLPGGANIHDSTVAIFFAVLLFAIPVDLKRREFALDWEWAKKTPWGVLLLFGGGLALAKAFASSGLVLWMGGGFKYLEGLPPLLIIVCVALLLTFLTELTSNLATVSIMLPILALGAAPTLGVHPLLLMIPAAMSASCAFMLPVATPPNAIVFGSGYIRIGEMFRAGILINLLGVLLVTLVTYFIAIPIFDLTGPIPVAAQP